MQKDINASPVSEVSEGLDFNSFGLSDVLLNSLKGMKFQTPTPIQAQTIPLALKGFDVLGSANTGTGKTGAYGIPLIEHLLASPHSMALILTPTRELALQVCEILKQFIGGARGNIRTALLIGGDSMFKQRQQLKARPRLIVGTPGRTNDHLSRNTLNLDKADFVVFDETDRMLDMGFSIQLKQIAKYLPAQRQTLLFSATMNAAMVKTAQGYLKDTAKRVSVGSTTTPMEKIKQEMFRTSESEKYGLLLDTLVKNDGSCIVFVKTKMGSDKLASRLRGNGHDADALHGDLRQKHRERVVEAFRGRKFKVLVATDVAARGLDIPHIECVVNYDLPQCPEDYIHRIGRTGRAGAEGLAINLVTSQDNAKWRSIHKMMNPSARDEEPSAPRGARKPQPHYNKRRSSGGGNGNGYGRGNGGGGAPAARSGSGFAHKRRSRDSFERV